MPNVPNAPGVPALASFSFDSVALLFADAVGIILGVPPTAQQWGVFLDGEAVVESDNTLSFELRQDFPISDYPVEDGGFQNYDKVQLPIDIRLRVSRGGSVADRQEFINSIDAVMNTLDLYDVVTPEQVFTGFNFVHRDVRRTAQNGMGLVIVDLWLTEVRVTSTATFNSTRNPTASGNQNIGVQQPQTPPDSFDQGGFAEGIG